MMNTKMGDEQWSAHKTPDGRVYYCNMKTGQTSWLEPEGFRDFSEKSLSANKWEEFTTETGEKYYYNRQTNVTTWIPPDKFVNKNISPIKRTFEESPSNKQPQYKDDAIQMGEEYAQKVGAQLQEKNKATFKELLDEIKVTNNQTWNEVLPLIISDPRYRVVKPLARRKAFFAKYIDQVASEEKERKIEAFKKQKESLHNLFSTIESIDSTTTFSTLEKILENNPQYTDIPQDNRYTIFIDYINHIEKTEKDATRELRKRNIAKFHKILENLVSDKRITVETCWNDIDAIYRELPEFKSDPELMASDKDSFPIVYKEVMDKLMSNYKADKLEKERAQEIKDVKNRMEFRALISSLVEEGKITYKTIWLDIYPLVCDEQCYKNILSQHGATPVEIFGEFMYKLLKNYWRFNSKIRKALAAEKVNVTSQLDPQKFADTIMEFKILGLQQQMAIDIATELINLEKEKEEYELVKSEEKSSKKKIEAFKTYLKKNMTSFASESSWKQVKARIKSSNEYKCMNAKTREIALDKYMDRVKDGLNKYKARSDPSQKEYSKSKSKHKREKSSKAKYKHRSYSSKSKQRSSSSCELSDKCRDDSAEEGEVR